MKMLAAGLVVAFSVGAGVARGDIAYDNLTGQPYGGGLLYGSTEVAQDVRLAPGAGRRLLELAIEFRNATANADDAGQITMSVYADAAGAPGSLLASETFDFALARETSRVYEIDLGGVAAPSGRVWAAWYVQGTRTGVNFGGEPLVGSTDNLYFSRRRGVGDWVDEGVWWRDPFHIRVTTVPGPGALGALCAGLVGVRRRR